MSLHDLPKRWRSRARELERYAPPAAAAFTAAAEELERALAAAEDESLTLVEAAEESGYHPDYLGRLVREGRIRNVGRPGAPRIRRGDLPRKRRRRREEPAFVADAGHDSSSLAAIVRDAVAGRTKRR